MKHKKKPKAALSTSPLGQLSDVDLRLLRVFKSVVEAGGLSAAELELNIGRSTISRHLKDLEIRLGMNLAKRGRSGFALTDEGANIYRATLNLLGSIESFRNEVNDIHQSLTGKLSIALFDKTAGNPACHIDKAIARYVEEAPEVALELHVEPINVIEKGVMEGRFQLGVIPAHRESTSLSYLSLFNEQMYLYCGNNHPLFDQDDTVITASEVLQYPYAGLGYHSPNMEVGQKLSMQRGATAYDQEAIVHLVLSNCFLGYLPEHYAAKWVGRGEMRAIACEQFQYLCEFMAITKGSPKPSRILQSFLNCLELAHRQP
ncbi:MAG: LysR family transcriptional regulator [Cellvibrionaceae bacterium]|nr:LysR family transcriptional regulator [Cellvibrionaceae bacterium]